MRCVFSVDVEDWFHILGLPATPRLEEWDGLPSRIEKNFLTLLDIFARQNVRVSCFFLGWAAERFPGLVKEAAARGHEIASHGYAHRLVYDLTAEQFFRDAAKSKQILEAITGKAVLGYRASGFSLTRRTGWYYDKLIQAGYVYDSSVFPASREHGGMQGANRIPHTLTRKGGKIIEFPISTTSILGKRLCFFGGGYLRLFPYFLIKKNAAAILKQQNRPVIFYIHPREIDPAHPRLPMNLKRRFKCYVNLKTTVKKIENIIADFEFTTFADIVSHHKEPDEP
jgi:polysaccharide deacetylase family protein (PEP-CTERM system associated)